MMVEVFEYVCYRCLLYRRDRLSAAATSAKPKVVLGLRYHGCCMYPHMLQCKSPFHL